MTRVIGLDLSLTSTGIAVADHVEGIAYTEVVKSSGKKNASVHDTAERLRTISEAVIDTCLLMAAQADLIVIEAPSYGSHTGSQHERGGLWWMTATKLRGWNYTLATVSPQGRAKYATGKGNAGKDEVLAAVVKRYIKADIVNNDVADAVVLAAMGMRHLGRAIDNPLAETNKKAMEGAQWPL